jgi:hypothetical protein
MIFTWMMRLGIFLYIVEINIVMLSSSYKRYEKRILNYIHIRYYNINMKNY